MRTLLSRFTFGLVISSLALLLGVAPLRSQEEQPPSDDKPKPAGNSSNPIPLVDQGEQSGQGNDADLIPDNTPLTGVLAPTLGSPEIRHSYWVPGVQWSGAIQSHSYNQTANSSWLVNNYFIGNLSLLEVWRHSQLAINYSAGGFISSDSTQGNGYYQNLVLSQTLQWNRWLVQIFDQFSYLPQSSLGFGGGTSLGIPGAGGSPGPVIPGIGGTYVPNQNIFASVGPRYSNTSTVQLTYTTTPRGSVTLSGTYSLLNFVQSGNVDNDTVYATAGYNYTLTRADSVGVFYRFGAFHYSGEPQANGDHSINVAYSRKLTGRLALQISAGSDFITSRIAVNGNTLTHGVSSSAHLSYATHHGGLSVGYTHGLSGGSGVLTGSTGDQLNFAANRSLGRIWTGQINVGYSHNSSLTNNAATPAPTFNTWNAGGGVSRALGRNATFAVAYNATLTDYGAAGCTGSGCTSNQNYQYITLSFQWHTRPFILP